MASPGGKLLVLDALLALPMLGGTEGARRGGVNLLGLEGRDDGHFDEGGLATERKIVDFEVGALNGALVVELGVDVKVGGAAAAGELSRHGVVAHGEATPEVAELAVDGRNGGGGVEAGVTGAGAQKGRG